MLSKSVREANNGVRTPSTKTIGSVNMWLTLCRALALELAKPSDFISVLKENFVHLYKVFSNFLKKGTDLLF